MMQLDRIERLLLQILNEVKRMDPKLAALQAEVTNAQTVELSAITLIQGLAAAVKAAGTDPVQLAAIVQQLQTNDAALAAAVAANTVAAPTT